MCLCAHTDRCARDESQTRAVSRPSFSPDLYIPSQSTIINFNCVRCPTLSERDFFRHKIYSNDNQFHSLRLFAYVSYLISNCRSIVSHLRATLDEKIKSIKSLCAHNASNNGAGVTNTTHRSEKKKTCEISSQRYGSVEAGWFDGRLDT